MRKYAELSLATVAIVWGCTFVLVKAALDDVSTLLFLTLRFTLAAAALAILFRRKAAALRSSLGPSCVVGLLLFAGYVTQTAGLRYTSAANSALITGMYIVLVPLFSALVYQKVPRIWEWLGVGFAFTGMALMTLRPGAWSLNRGDLLTLACAGLYAFHILALGRYSERLSFEGLALGQIATGAVAGWLTFWWIEPAYIKWSPAVAAALAVTSLLATALAFSVQSWAQKYTTPTRTALLFALEPVSALLVAVLLAGEAVTGRSWLGAGLILAGILLVELKPAARPEHPSA